MAWGLIFRNNPSGMSLGLMDGLNISHDGDSIIPAIPKKTKRPCCRGVDLSNTWLDASGF